MLINQNFSIPAGDDGTVQIEVLPDDFVTLQNVTAFWYAYEQQYGCVVPGSSPLITKSSTDPTQLVIPGSPPNYLYLIFAADDTVNLLRNYYHEACYFDQNGAKVTVTEGIMTVLGTENRPSGY